MWSLFWPQYQPLVPLPFSFPPASALPSPSFSSFRGLFSLWFLTLSHCLGPCYVRESSSGRVPACLGSRLRGGLWECGDSGLFGLIRFHGWRLQGLLVSQWGCGIGNFFFFFFVYLNFLYPDWFLRCGVCLGCGTTEERKRKWGYWPTSCLVLRCEEFLIFLWK